MSEYKVLFLDIDGTIITPDDSIEQSTIKAIRQIKEKAWRFFWQQAGPYTKLENLPKN